MKVVLLNLPHYTRIQRRYMCSYHAQSMLLPPQELIALGGIIRDFQGIHTSLIDCIAEELNNIELENILETINPDVIVSLQGFECFEEDIAELERIKQRFPDTRLVLFGHYATVFPHEILRRTSIDIIIKGEPDLIFFELISALFHHKPLHSVAGIAFKKADEICETSGEIRIKESDKLPMPAYELLKADKYFEPFMKAPFGLIQSARGCPYSCNYCVRSFGKKLTYRTPQQIIEEIKYLKDKFGIKSLRFIDDTFTANSKRVIEICQKIIEEKIDIQWTCLSRVDTIKEEMIPIMKEAGCKRIYFGVESGSNKVLQYLNKQLDLSQALYIVKKCKRQGIETFGWFIVGAPNEDEEAFQESIEFALDAGFDYIAVSELIVYPGTELFDKLKDEIDFSLLPYRNQWKDTEKALINRKREQEFYRRFYFRKEYVTSKVVHAFHHPIEYLSNILKLATYLLFPRLSKRADYF